MTKQNIIDKIKQLCKKQGQYKPLYMFSIYPFNKMKAINLLPNRQFIQYKIVKEILIQNIVQEENSIIIVYYDKDTNTYEHMTIMINRLKQNNDGCIDIDENTIKIQTIYTDEIMYITNDKNILTKLLKQYTKQIYYFNEFHKQQIITLNNNDYFNTSIKLLTYDIITKLYNNTLKKIKQL